MIEAVKERDKREEEGGLKSHCKKSVICPSSSVHINTTDRGRVYYPRHIHTLFLATLTETIHFMGQVTCVGSLATAGGKQLVFKKPKTLHFLRKN